jgi:hypothetical protein
MIFLYKLRLQVTSDCNLYTVYEMASHAISRGIGILLFYFSFRELHCTEN